MGKVIPLQRPTARPVVHESPSAPRLIDLGLSEDETNLFAFRAGEIAQKRPFTEFDLDSLSRLVLLSRAHRALAAVDDDLAAAVRRRELQILEELGV